MFKDWPLPTIFAHRGASANAPENTLAAFELAHRQAADAIELDAMLTADGQIVVIHDATVDRTTNGHGAVSTLPLAALKDLDAGAHFSAAFQGEKIPTLEEVFAAFGKVLFINVELKNYASPTDDLPQKVCALVQKHELQGRVMFSSFNPLALFRTNRLLPEVPNGLLTISGAFGALLRSPLGNLVPHQALHPPKGDVSQRLVKHEHARGHRVHVYTVNTQADLARMFSSGVDGVFTDDPLLARQVLDGMTESVG